MAIPPLGLLLDVDGPIASPVSRDIAIPSIIDDLVTLAAASVPIAFITGRSDHFIAERVITPLLAAGLDEALDREGTRMFGVFEKGAAWAPVSRAGLGDVTVDSSVRVPESFVERIRALHRDEYTDTMFWDDTKHAMISVEQRTDVADAEYHSAQLLFNDAVFAAAVNHGLGMRFGARESVDSSGAIPFRIDPTIISTDVESVQLDKDRGAERALEYFAATGPLPSLWRSVGDSRSDYKMADFVHSRGLEVAHVDVRPGDGVLDRPYRVILEGDLIHDDAGAAFLRYWVKKLGLG